MQGEGCFFYVLFLEASGTYREGHTHRGQGDPGDGQFFLSSFLETRSTRGGPAAKIRRPTQEKCCFSMFCFWRPGAL